MRAKKRTTPSGGDSELAGGSIAIDGASKKHPMWMGYCSGLNGPSGRRVKEMTALFTIKPPSTKELGIAERVDSSAWPLHVKDVGEIKIDALLQSIEVADLREAALQAKSWLISDTNYGITWPIEARNIPFSKFTPAQVEVMWRAGKIKPFDDDAEIRCSVRGFTVPQDSKQRLRPVFEPMNNAVIHFTESSTLRLLPCGMEQAKIRKIRSGKWKSIT